MLVCFPCLCGTPHPPRAVSRDEVFACLPLILCASGLFLPGTLAVSLPAAPFSCFPAVRLSPTVVAPPALTRSVFCLVDCATRSLYRPRLLLPPEPAVWRFVAPLPGPLTLRCPQFRYHAGGVGFAPFFRRPWQRHPRFILTRPLVVLSCALARRHLTRLCPHFAASCGCAAGPPRCLHPTPCPAHFHDSAPLAPPLTARPCVGSLLPVAASWLGFF